MDAITREKNRRRREKILVVVLFTAVIIFTAVEIHLLKTSAKLPFVNSIFFFGLMNLNIVLIMLLIFLVFRNAIKLILDQRKGVIGSRLRTRLVLCFSLFAIIPTILLFSVSAFYIKSSFDKWFNIKIGGTLQKAIEVVHTFNENTEKNASHFVRKIALSIKDQNGVDIEKTLETARLEYGLDAVEFYKDPFSHRLISVNSDQTNQFPALSMESLQYYFAGKSDCRVQNVGIGETVRCAAYLGKSEGVVFASYFIPMSLASQLSQISLSYSDYQSDNPLNYPIKSTYFAILSMMTLLILFSATWTGFYVARRLSVPIEELSKGTEQIASGNLDYQISKEVGSDELSKLVESFNHMTRDLKLSKMEVEATTEDLKTINAELYQRRRYIEVLLESVQSGVISLGPSEQVTMINPAATRLLRLIGKNVLSEPYWEVIPADLLENFKLMLANVYEGSKPVRREFRFRAPGDHELVTLLVHCSVLQDENKEQIGVVAVLDDVTEIQKMERMTAWREVAKRIAHEIKNPLTPIQLSVQRLRRRYLETIKDDGTFEQSTKIILNEVDSLKTLVSEFSSFARLPEIQQRPEDLNDIVLEAVNLFRTAHESIFFELNLDDSLSPLELDRLQLKRVLINLFDNAVSAMAGKGTITVNTEYLRKEGNIVLAVGDRGCGIPEKMQSQLFEPYFSTKKGGMGLGLAIVQRIVTDHGGFVRIAASEKCSTLFMIEFPESLIAAPKVSPMAAVPESEISLGEKPLPVDGESTC